LQNALASPHTHSLALLALFRLREAKPELFT